jgi:CheY-like chemotaxis protein/HPt (histidine-containing phosphotransfer) domain-containing protein
MTLLKWFTAYINKPVKRRSLGETINLVLGEPVAELEVVPGGGGDEGEPAPVPAPAPAAGELSPAAGGGLPSAAAAPAAAAGDAGGKPLILIVEDHLVNQKLFAMIMDKLGFPSVLAGDGLDALEKAAAHEAALIFMDIQMPRMNGYEAAETLRKRGFRRPIIAVTASALADERERCLSVGFDDILIKPFKRPDIEGMLKKWIGVRQDGPVWDAAPMAPGAAGNSPSPAGAPAASGPAPEIFDTADLMETFMDNDETARSLLAHFLERTETQIAGLPALIKQGDWESAHREAHTVKGSALTLGGKELGKAAARLETACKNQDKPEADAAFPPVSEAFARFKTAVLAYLKTEAPATPGV